MRPKSIDYPVSGIDFYPTLLDLVGVEKDPKPNYGWSEFSTTFKGTIT